MTKKFLFFDSNALKNFHKRIFFSITIFIFVYFVAFYRIVDVMIFEKSNNVINNNSQIIERGSIYDRNGYLLSSTIKSYSLSVNPSNLENKDLLSDELSLIISKPKEEIFNLLNQKIGLFDRAASMYDKVLSLNPDSEIILEKLKLLKDND